MKIVQYALAALVVYIVGYAYIEFVPFFFSYDMPSISEYGFLVWLINLVFAIASPMLFTALALGIAISLISQIMKM